MSIGEIGEAYLKSIIITHSSNLRKNGIFKPCTPIQDPLTGSLVANKEIGKEM